MERSYANELSGKLAGKKVLLQGFVHEIRDLAKIKFLLLRDFSGIVQCVAPAEKVKKEIFEAAGKLTPESVVEITGIVVESKIAKKGFEVLIGKISVISRAEALPIQVFEKDKAIKTDLSTRMDNRPIDLRKPEVNAIFKIQAKLVLGMQEVLNKKGFLQVFTPCIMGEASEGGAEVFKLDYFGKNAFLRQDPQLHRQLAILGGIERLYDVGTNWRAELSHTTRHLCEYRSIAPEMAFLSDETDTMRLEEDVIIGGIKKAVGDCKNEIELIGVKMKIPEKPFPELRFPKIYDILNEMGKSLPRGQDLDAEAMNLLGDYVKKKFKNDFYFVNRFPSKIKPFYVMYVDEEEEFARSVDLNFGEVELSSGGQREHRHEKIIAHLRERNLNPRNFEWFTKFFRFGAPPHGGFAIGIERLTKCILNLENVKEASLFVRDPERLLP